MLLKRTALAAALLAALAVPASGAAAQERGTGRDGWMGISFDWPEGAARDRAVVKEVYPASPALRAGIARGDVILRIDGRPATEEEVARLRGRLEPGDTVRLRTGRDGREQDRVVVVAARPDPQEVAETMIRMHGDSVTAHVIYRPSTGERRFPGDTLLAWRMEGDSAIQMGPGGRNVVLRFKADSMRVMADSMLRHLDSLRVKLHADAAAHGPVFLRFDSTFRFDSTLARGAADLGTAMRGMEAMRFEMPAPGEVPFFLEVGRRAMAGAEFAEMNEGLARYFGNTRDGLLVLQVSPSTPSARAGLEAGDVVVKANGRDVQSVRDLRMAVRDAEGGRLALEVVRQGRRRTLQMQWDRNEELPFRTQIRSEVIRVPSQSRTQN